MKETFPVTVAGQRIFSVFFPLITVLFVYNNSFNIKPVDIISISYQLLGYIYLFCALIIRLKKVNKLELNKDHIVLYGKELSHQSIRKIVIQGYFMPWISVSHGKHPFYITNLPFRFHVNKEAAVIELINWARQHNIQIKVPQYLEQQAKRGA